ncbi:MAG: YraN family protein [Bacteroidales bacterium]|nr:YraN family protein [Bacteroidales bacterium]
MDSTFTKGRQGEDIACRFLQNKGYRIIQRNYVYRKHEVDIIAQDKNEIVFVEVKQRGTDFFGQPYKAVDLKKQKSIVLVANYYIQKYNIDLEARFDIVSITDDSSLNIEHIQNAFTPSL